MPGLLRGVGRVAVAAGTATAVSNRVSRRQANRWAEQDPQAYGYDEPQPQPQYYEQAPAPAPAAGQSTEDKITQLKAIGELKASGVLTDAEFEAQKAKILAG